jgi:hypothetical protein
MVFEKYKDETSKKPSLRAFFSEAVSCLQGDRFGKKRLAMTSGFLQKNGWRENGSACALCSGTPKT